MSLTLLRYRTRTKKNMKKIYQEPKFYKSRHYLKVGLGTSMTLGKSNIGSHSSCMYSDRIIGLVMGY